MPEDPPTVLEPRDAELLTALASAPRPTGGARVTALRARCALELRALGYDTREMPFGYSALPGRYGTPAVSALGMAVVAIAGHWGARGSTLFPLGVTIAGIIGLGLLGRWLARDGVMGAPWMRAEGVNLEATRPGQPVRVWLCAHLDSKSQPVPTLLRSAGIALQTLGSLATLGLAAAAAFGASAPFAVWVGAVMVTLAGAIPVVSSVVGPHSPGALDNASGVVAVLAAARRLTDVEGVGIVITDAEELGMAGAHAWAAARAGAVVLNCDGVDDRGTARVMHPAKRPRAILDAVRGVRASPAPDVRRLPLGVLTDSVAIARRGGTSVTFSRGDWSSLARVHGANDSLERLRGTGIPGMAALMAEVARRLATTPASSGTHPNED